MPRIGASLSATDRLTLGYLGALGLVTILWHAEPSPLLERFVLLAILIAGSATARPTSTAARIVHDFLPVAAMAFIFNWTGPVIVATHPPSWDPVIVGLDRQLFGTLPDRWFGVLGRPWWLTDAASLAYVSYYFVPVGMAIALYAAGRRADFGELVFTLVATLLVTYACYFVVPTYGPRVPIDDEARVLGGSALSAGIRTALRYAEGNVLDAFPSGHTTVSLVYLACGWRLFPRWRIPLAVVVAGIVFSTVYLSVHYVIDVAAGVVLAALLPLALPALRRWAAPAPSPTVLVQRPSSSARQPRPDHPMRSNRPLR